MSVSPGWYPDPAEPTTQRYWDGEQWVGGPVPVGVEPPTVPPPAIPPAVLAIETPADVRPPSEIHVPDAPAGTAPYAAPAGAPTDSILTAAPARPGPALAAPVLRLAARLIDITAVCTLALVVNSYFLYLYLQEIAPQVDALARQLQGGPQAPQTVVSAHAQRLSGLIVLTSIALWCAYEVPATASTGQTLGKRIVGLRVERLDGSALSLWQSTRRWLIMAIPSSVPGSACLGLPVQMLDCAWCSWDKPLRQALHDKAVQTIVVVGGPRRPESPSNE